VDLSPQSAGFSGWLRRILRINVHFANGIRLQRATCL
jgi:hypothetical protein